MHADFGLEGQKERDLQGDLDLEREMENIKMDITEIGLGSWIDSSGSGQGLLTDCSEHSTELLVSIKCWEFLLWMSNCWLLMNDLVPCS
jgi:hypothetical protein